MIRGLIGTGVGAVVAWLLGKIDPLRRIAVQEDGPPTQEAPDHESVSTMSSEKQVPR